MRDARAAARGKCAGRQQYLRNPGGRKYADWPARGSPYGAWGVQWRAHGLPGAANFSSGHDCSSAPRPRQVAPRRAPRRAAPHGSRCTCQARAPAAAAIALGATPAAAAAAVECEVRAARGALRNMPWTRPPGAAPSPLRCALRRRPHATHRNATQNKRVRVHYRSKGLRVVQVRGGAGAKTGAAGGRRRKGALRCMQAAAFEVAPPAVARLLNSSTGARRRMGRGGRRKHTVHETWASAAGAQVRAARFAGCRC